MGWAVRGFILTGPKESAADLDHECMRDLIDLPETGTVDWDALGFGCREPFYRSSMERVVSERSTNRTSHAIIFNDLLRRNHRPANGTFSRITKLMSGSSAADPALAPNRSAGREAFQQAPADGGQ